MTPSTRLAALGLALAALLGTLPACVPVLATGAAVTAVAAGDRRSAGAQIDDQSLQVRGNLRVKEILPGDENAYAYVTSYNRRILLTGLAPDARAKERAERAVATLDGVRGVFNELQVGAPQPGASSARDTVTSTRVRSALFQEKDVESTAVKIVTEARTVYLMGLVTRAEGERIAKVASRIPGVERVVTLWDPISDQDLADLQRERATATEPTGKSN
jgi:osmotically-inducible protein OsmY